MTEPYILCGDIQIPIDRTSHLLLGHSNSTEKDSWVLKWFQRWRTRTSFVVTFKFNWKRQFNLEKIWKITKLYILCGAIQNPTEKDSSLTKWLQRWQNITLFAGTFNFHLKKTVQYWNDYKDDRTLHSLLGHSNSDWKKQFSIKMISKTTELYILCRDIQVTTEKKQFSIEMISKMTEPCIPCGDNQFQLKNQFSIQMISRIRELYILFGTFKSQLKNTDYYSNDYKDDRPWHSSLAHSNFNWKKLTYFVGTFKFQLEKNSSLSKWLQRWQNLTSFGGHSNSNWKKNSSLLKWFQRWQTPSSFVGTFKIQLKKKVHYRNDYKDDRK